MTVPNDPLNRCWVEVSDANPTLVAALRPTLVSFMTDDHTRRPGIAGTGFIVAATNELAMVFTAKHVLSEGVLGIQKPYRNHSTPSLFEPASARTPSLNYQKVKAFYANSQFADLFNVIHASYNDSLDIALCIIEIRSSSDAKFEPLAIPIHPVTLSVGDVIHMISLINEKPVITATPMDETGAGQSFILARKVSIRIGTVTATYPNGFRQYKWPCFATSIPTVPGMSGGFVCIPTDGTTIAACGVVCADNTPVEDQNDCFKCGESVIGYTWPALALRAPTTLPPTLGSDDLTLYEMIRRGHLPLPPGGVDHIEIVDRGINDTRIGIKSPQI
jgi:Trypsin-like peptidase domain